MNHAWIALLLPMFLSPRAPCDKHKEKNKETSCNATRTMCCQNSKSSCCGQKDAKHDEDADADEQAERGQREAELAVERAEREAEVAQRDAEEQAERAEREAEAQVEQADRESERAERESERAEREAERAAREAEEHAERADQDDEDLQMDLKDSDDDSDAEGVGDSQSYARVLDLSQLDQESAAKVHEAVERAMEQAKSAMKKVKGSCKALDADTQKKIAQALKAANVSGSEVEKAMRVSRETLAKALADQHVYAVNGWPLASLENNLRGLSRVDSSGWSGSNDKGALEERVAALEAKLGIHRDDDAHPSLEERVAELERRTGTARVRVAPRSGTHRAPRAAVVVPTPPPAPPQVATPAVPPAPPQPELWMRSGTPRAPAAIATPTPPSPPTWVGPGQNQRRSHAASADQRHEIQERMQKMREEMEKLREEMTRLRDELTSEARGSGSSR